VEIFSPWSLAPGSHGISCFRWISEVGGLSPAGLSEEERKWQDLQFFILAEPLPDPGVSRDRDDAAETDQQPDSDLEQAPYPAQITR
jgi:hypothetical protein